jgi:hypothetical protein
VSTNVWFRFIYFIEVYRFYENKTMNSTIRNNLSFPATILASRLYYTSADRILYLPEKSRTVKES